MKLLIQLTSRDAVNGSFAHTKKTGDHKNHMVQWCWLPDQEKHKQGKVDCQN